MLRWGSVPTHIAHTSVSTVSGNHLCFSDAQEAFFCYAIIFTWTVAVTKITIVGCFFFFFYVAPDRWWLRQKARGKKKRNFFLQPWGQMSWFFLFSTTARASMVKTDNTQSWQDSLNFWLLDVESLKLFLSNLLFFIQFIDQKICLVIKWVFNQELWAPYQPGMAVLKGAGDIKESKAIRMYLVVDGPTPNIFWKLCINRSVLA